MILTDRLVFIIIVIRESLSCRKREGKNTQRSVAIFFIALEKFGSFILVKSNQSRALDRAHWPRNEQPLIEGILLIEKKKIDYCLRINVKKKSPVERTRCLERINICWYKYT